MRAHKALFHIFNLGIVRDVVPPVILQPGQSLAWAKRAFCFRQIFRSLVFSPSNLIFVHNGARNFPCCSTSAKFLCQQARRAADYVTRHGHARRRRSVGKASLFA